MVAGQAVWHTHVMINALTFTPSKRRFESSHLLWYFHENDVLSVRLSKNQWLKLIDFFLATFESTASMLVVVDIYSAVYVKV
jgi:hypothetical protein